MGPNNLNSVSDVALLEITYPLNPCCSRSKATRPTCHISLAYIRCIPRRRYGGGAGPPRWYLLGLRAWGLSHQSKMDPSLTQGALHSPPYCLLILRLLIRIMLWVSQLCQGGYHVLPGWISHVECFLRLMKLNLQPSFLTGTLLLRATWSVWSFIVLFACLRAGMLRSSIPVSSTWCSNKNATKSVCLFASAWSSTLDGSVSLALMSASNSSNTHATRRNPRWAAICKGTLWHFPGMFASATASGACSSIERISSTRNSSSMHLRILEWKYFHSSSSFGGAELGADETLSVSSSGDWENVEGGEWKSDLAADCVRTNVCSSWFDSTLALEDNGPRSSNGFDCYLPWWAASC